MSRPDTAESADAQLRNLRSRISDLGHQIDSYQTKTAAAFGGGVFLFLLAAGAAYDLVVGKSGVWSTLGVSRDALVWIAGVLGVGSIGLLAFALVQRSRRDARLDSTLNQLEQQYAELLERTNGDPRSTLDH